MGERFAKQNLAQQNRIDLDKDYRNGAADADDRQFPTRLGIEQRVLALARWEGETLRPWATDGCANATELWALSEVSASVHKLLGLSLPDQSDGAIKAATSDWPDWRRKTVAVCPVNLDGTICNGLLYDKGMGIMFASPETRG